MDDIQSAATIPAHKTLKQGLCCYEVLESAETRQIGAWNMRDMYLMSLKIRLLASKEDVF